jgi:hypothetical protein
MQAVEDLCVKYLMNEMDPAERFAFEEQMLADPNLIIEVEMMRKTLGKLKEIPVLKTPENLAASVRMNASKHARSKRIVQLIQAPVWRYAAILAGVGFAFSFGWYFNATDSVGHQAEVVREVQSSNKSNKTVWNDKKDVLSIDAYNVAAQNPVDSVALQHAKKLRLINEPIIEGSYTDELLLTRTRK